ncbi:MAG: Oxidoreductase [Actinomycetota bacterium]|nr:Oxidoreductase [Actinomycetota bacterium]
MSRPTLAVWKFASCDGCQLTLLNCEDELTDLLRALDVAYFPEATRAASPGPFDISLVEGSITTPADAERIVEVRRLSRCLVTIGACATSGGIQALRNTADVDEYRRLVYPRPDLVAVLDRSTPIATHVTVDVELPGCPVDRHQLLEVIDALLHDRRPRLPTYGVCVECRRAEAACVLVSRGLACLGPVTRAGCGALCPRHGRGCYGCFGPQEAANPSALSDRLVAEGTPRRDVVHLFRTVTAGAEPFRREAARQEEARQEEADRS